MNIKPPSTMVGTEVPTVPISLQIISILKVASYILIPIGLIIGIIYIIKSKKRILTKNIIGVVIILVPIVICMVLQVISVNMYIENAFNIL